MGLWITDKLKNIFGSKSHNTLEGFNADDYIISEDLHTQIIEYTASRYEALAYTGKKLDFAQKIRDQHPDAQKEINRTIKDLKEYSFLEKQTLESMFEDFEDQLKRDKENNVFGNLEIIDDSLRNRILIILAQDAQKFYEEHKDLPKKLKPSCMCGQCPSPFDEEHAQRFLDDDNAVRYKIGQAVQFYLDTAKKAGISLEQAITLKENDELAPILEKINNTEPNSNVQTPENNL